LVVGAGVSVALQQVLNADLRTGLGSPLWAALVSYLGGTLVFLAILIAAGVPRPTQEALAQTRWVSWTGGLFGAVFMVTPARLLGAVCLTAGVVLIRS
jgi:transporter family-2 protein